MSDIDIFIAYQLESQAAANTCRQALVDQGCSKNNIILWNPSAPWREPIFEVGRKIMNANIVIVISRPEARRSNWIAAETSFAERVGVPVVHLRAAKAQVLQLVRLQKLAEQRRYSRLVDTRIWHDTQVGSYEIQVYNELNLLELHAADRSHGLLRTMRRLLQTFDADLRIVASTGATKNFLLFAQFGHPRGLLCNFVFRPTVAMAERRGWLQKVEPSPEFGAWRSQLPTFVGGPHQFFDHFGPMTTWLGIQESREDAHKKPTEETRDDKTGKKDVN